MQRHSSLCAKGRCGGRKESCKGSFLVLVACSVLFSHQYEASHNGSLFLHVFFSLISIVQKCALLRHATLPGAYLLLPLQFFILILLQTASPNINHQTNRKPIRQAETVQPLSTTDGMRSLVFRRQTNQSFAIPGTATRGAGRVVHILKVPLCAVLVQPRRTCRDITALSLGNDIHAQCTFLHLLLVSFLQKRLQLQKCARRQ